MKHSKAKGIRWFSQKGIKIVSVIWVCVIMLEKINLEVSSNNLRKIVFGHEVQMWNIKTFPERRILRRKKKCCFYRTTLFSSLAKLCFSATWVDCWQKYNFYSLPSGIQGGHWNNSVLQNRRGNSRATKPSCVLWRPKPRF